MPLEVRSRHRHVLTALAVTFTSLAACGGDTSTTPGFDGETITLGLILPMTGPLQSVGEPIEAGYRAYVDGVNSDGGVDGRYRIELETVDSQYDPPIGVQKYNQVRDDVVMIGGVLGTPVVSALLEQLVRDEVIAAPLSFDSTWIHEPNLLPVGTPLRRAPRWLWSGR